jgi:hypothetical protein
MTNSYGTGCVLFIQKFGHDTQVQAGRLGFFWQAQMWVVVTEDSMVVIEAQVELEVGSVLNGGQSSVIAACSRSRKSPRRKWRSIALQSTHIARQ